MNLLSQLSTSSAKLVVLNGFSISAGVSFLWYSQYYMILLRMWILRLGKGISSSPPVSSSIFLIKTDLQATCSSTSILSPSWDTSLTIFFTWFIIILVMLDSNIDYHLVYYSSSLSSIIIIILGLLTKIYSGLLDL